jgi:malonyl-CoA O-methyltransferase
MLRPTGLERATVRAAFNDQRSIGRQADFLFREVDRRMLERLDLIKLQPVARVLDVGCGSGRSLANLAVRYPDARMIGTDLADRLVAEAAGEPARERRLAEGARRWLARLGVGGSRPLPATMPLWLAADAHALPVAANSIDMVWSNLAAHWFDDPLAAIAEWHRVIRPEGLLMFSAFGVDTLKEVRPPVPVGAGARAGGPGGDGQGGAAGSAGTAPGWPSFQDMHDWGDALSAAGFADPVMDVERLTLTYEDEGRFWDDAESLAMLPGLRQRATSDGARRADSQLALSIELVYGHAWCPPVKRRADGLAVVQIHRNRGRL